MAEERGGSSSLFIFLAGGLIGAGLSILYTPMTGEKTSQYLRIQTKKAKKKARHLSESFREDVPFYQKPIAYASCHITSNI